MAANPDGLEFTNRVKCFGGWATRYRHSSKVIQDSNPMNFYVFVPPKQNEDQRFPVLFYLAGLECTDETFIIKGGAMKYAAKHGIILVCPDTSPRGSDLLDGEADSWTFGLGAGFYLDATTPGYSKKYLMYTYITQELHDIVHRNFPTMGPSKQGIFGHSMGGHGALTIALKNPDKFKSVSAFAPICHPTVVPWGTHAFKGYLGEDQEKWKSYDASILASNYSGSTKFDILIDQGGDDKFLEVQLKPQDLIEAAKGNSNLTVNLRMHSEYGHSYFFVSTFMEDHLAHHAKYLCQ